MGENFALGEWIHIPELCCTCFCNGDSFQDSSFLAMELSIIALFGDQYSWGSCVPLFLLDLLLNLQALHLTCELRFSTLFTNSLPSDS